MSASRIDQMIMGLEGLSSLDRQDIEALQLAKLNALLPRLNKRGYYSGKLPDKLDSISKLCQLPFTSPEELAASSPAFLQLSQSQVQRVLSDSTSGTSGLGKRVFYSLKDCENTVELFKAGLGELVFPGSVTMVCMPFSGPYGLGELICTAIEALGARALKAGCALSYGEYADLIEQEKPDSFVGMPVQLLSILRSCGKGNLQRALISADACPDTVVNECEKILGTRLFPHYGSRELGLGGAVSCPAHSGMHMRDNHVICEIIDDEGRVLPGGEYGELVITTIGMEAMPLIRYRTGDFTRIIPGLCSCGSYTTRLDKVQRSNGKMAEIDEKLFSCPWLIDFKAAARPESIGIYGIVAAGTDIVRAAESISALLEETVEIQLQFYDKNQKSLYSGKRCIL